MGFIILHSGMLDIKLREDRGKRLDFTTIWIIQLLSAVI